MSLRFNRIFFFLLAANLLASCARPLADFSYPDQSLKVPAKIQFENKSKRAESYQWDFGDGKKSEETTPTHKYLNSGTYEVKLEAKKGNKSATTTRTIVVKPPKNCLVQIETNYGNMTVELYDATPEHRDNFIKLAEEEFFDGLIFHRVINGFMIQGGDPESKSAKPKQALGNGGPGYTIPAEFVDTLVHLKGALAAARTGDNVNPKKRSSGSQFYIVQGKKLKEQELRLIEAKKNISYTPEQLKAYQEIGGTPFLDREYTVFGRVIDGLEVIDKIGVVQTDGRDRPKEDVKMKIRVIQ